MLVFRPAKADVVGAFRVGVAYEAKERGGFITHDARHTAITRMLQASVDLSTVGAITGHSDSQLITALLACDTRKP